MKPKLVKVITPNRMLFIKGRLVRSPFESIIKFKQQLSLLEQSLRLQGAEYTIEDYIEKKKVEEKIVVEEKVIPKKTKKSEPKTTLEKIAAESEE